MLKMHVGSFFKNMNIIKVGLVVLRLKNNVIIISNKEIV